MKNNADKMVNRKTLLNYLRGELQTFSDKIEDLHEKYFVSLCLFIGELSPLLLRDIKE